LALSIKYYTPKVSFSDRVQWNPPVGGEVGFQNSGQSWVYNDIFFKKIY